MRTIKAVWSLAGTSIMISLVLLSVAWVGQLTYLNWSAQCERAGSVFAKKSADLIAPLRAGDLVALKNELTQLMLPPFAAIEMRMAPNTEPSLLRPFYIGRADSELVCEQSLVYLGSPVASVLFRMSVADLVKMTFVEHLPTIAFFWLLTAAAIAYANSRISRVFNAVTDSLTELSFAQPLSLGPSMLSCLRDLPQENGIEPVRQSLENLMRTLATQTEMRLRLDMLEQKSTLQRQVGHDIRAPLSALKIVCDKSKGLTSSERELLLTCYQRIEDVAQDLLSVRPHIQDPATDISAAIQEVVREQEIISDQTSFMFEAQGETLAKGISCAEFKRILSNLFTNAREAGANLVDVFVCQNGTGLTVNVRDNGSGIPFELKRKILTQQGQVSSKPKGHGLGLGHAIRTIKTWGGDLSFVDGSHVGTHIAVKLPVDVSATKAQ